jgi:hypothetical protein
MNFVYNIKRSGMMNVSKKFWEELIAYFPLIRHGPYRKRRLQQFFVPAGTSLPSCYLATIGRYTHRHTDSSMIRHGPHTKRRVQYFFLFQRAFVAAVTRLLSRCLAPKVEINFTEPLPCNDRRDIRTVTQTDGRDLWCMPLRWAQLPWYTYQVS